MQFICKNCGYVEKGTPGNYCTSCGSKDSFVPKDEEKTVVYFTEQFENNTGQKELPEDELTAIREMEQVNADVEHQEDNKTEQVVDWGDWEKKEIGHSASLAAIMQLKMHTDKFSSNLAKARKQWMDQKQSSQKIYDTLIQSANVEFDRDLQNHNNNYSTAIQRVNETRTRIRNITNACESFKSSISSSGLTSAITQANTQIGMVETQRKAVESQLAKKEKALADFREASIAESQTVKNQKHDKARTEQIDRDSHNEKEYNNLVRKIVEEGNNDISKGFNKEKVHAYAQSITSLRFNGDLYDCPNVVPDCIMLGDICLDICGNEDSLSVIQAVEEEAMEYGQKNENDYTIKLPYCQRISDGISLQICYNGVDREFAQSLIQPVLLKLFMSIPAGKLEATMIDPLELGASFSDIHKIAEGPNSARIIDTKVWSKEKDIENAIATLRQRLEDMTQAYGGDTESRLKKEVIRALAITDFPSGFTETALKDLHAIVRNSASLGVCVLMCVNNEEMEQLRKRHGNLVDEIEQSVVALNVKNKKLLLSTDSSERVYIELDKMEDVYRNKEIIIEKISNVIEHMQLKVEHFESMFKFDVYDCNNWFTGSRSEISVPIGIKGANTIVKMVLGRGGGSVEHHALIAGQTGAGKSTFLHTLILSTMISYSPDDVQMYLLDFKEGVEFAPYTRYRLPSLRVVAINSEREFGLNILKELCAELDSRTKHFTRYGVADILSYGNIPGAPKIPKLLLIFDEVQELFRSGASKDSISSEALSCIGKLVTQGRAMGIHLILACQDFRNCAGLSDYFSQMSIRVAVKGSVDGASSILSADNAGIKTLQNQPAGAAIYNGGAGVESANNVFQVSYINEDNRIRLIETLDDYYTDPAVVPMYKNKETRVLLTNAQDDVNNCINRLIYGGQETIEHIGKTKNGYGMLLGQGFGRKSRFMIEIQPKPGDNMLVVSKDEKIALSIFEIATLSVLYEELHTEADKANALVYIIDLFADELSDDDCDFDYIEEHFEKQVKIAKIGASSEMIETIYNIVMDRTEGKVPSEERLFVLFFGLNRARKLRNTKIYDNDFSDELTPMEMLKKIIQHGPKQNVNTIVWSENIRGVEMMLGDRYESLFDKRIAYGLSEEDMDLLVAESSSKLLGSQTAVYMDVSTDIKNTHFRPYEIPTKTWVEDYADVYEEIISEGSDI